MAEIGIKYCGGCNPLIDRARLAKDIENMLGPGYKLVRVPAQSTLEIALLICGCETTCAEGPDVTGPEGQARTWIIIGGPAVDRAHIPEKEMARAIVEKLRALQGVPEPE